MKPVLLLLSIGGVFCFIVNDPSYPYDYADQRSKQKPKKGSKQAQHLTTNNAYIANTAKLHLWDSLVASNLSFIVSRKPLSIYARRYRTTLSPRRKILYGRPYVYACVNQVKTTSLEDILTRASLQAVGAYSQIVQKFSQSLANLKTAVEKWAITYGLEHEYRKIVNESERESADYKTAVKEMYSILMEFLGNYMKIENDKKRSLMLPFKRTSALPDRFDTRQQSIFERVIKSYNPSLASNNAGKYGSYAGNFITFLRNSGNYNRGTGGLGIQDYPVNTGPYTEGGFGAKYTDYTKGYPSNNGLLPRADEADSAQWLF